MMTSIFLIKYCKVKMILSVIYIVFNYEETPIHSAFSIAIAQDSLDVLHRDKAVICLVQKGAVASCLPTKWVNDTLRAESRTFGQYGVVIDSIAPHKNKIIFL